VLSKVGFIVIRIYWDWYNIITTDDKIFSHMSMIALAHSKKVL